MFSLFPSFPRISGVWRAKEILAFLVVFLAVFQKGKEKKIRARMSGKEKNSHKHKQIFPVTAQAGGGSPEPGGGGAKSPDRWPGVKSLCAVCGTQGT